MFIKILFPGAVMAHTGDVLRRVLSRPGRRVEAVACDADSELAGFDLLLKLEALAFGRPLPPSLTSDGADGGDAVAAREVTIDLRRTSGGSEPGRGLVLSVACNGEAGIAGLASAVLSRAPAQVSVFTVTDGAVRIWAQGLTVSSRPNSPAASLDEMTVRLGHLVDMALLRMEQGQEPEPGVAKGAAGSGGLAAAGRFVATSLRARIANRLTELSHHPSHWSVSWRRAADSDLVSHRLAWPDAPYRQLPDDGKRYYADPFLFQRDGRTFLFVEEYPYEIGRGLLSVAEWSDEGAWSTPRPILQGADHLSYPQVFAHDGQVWMIPETSSSRRIELYRAVDFPDRWVREAVLVDDVDASDATLTIHDGRFWLFATLSPHASSSRDMLGLFHAPSLQGPWRAHAANPVLVDARTARPGGATFERDGSLMRVAQDGVRGYGSAMTICRVDRLDTEGFAQTQVAALPAPAAWRVNGVHTLNAGHGFEVIDTLAKARKT